MQDSWSFILLELEVRSPETARGQTPLCHVGVYVLDPRHAESTQKTNVKLNKGLLNDAQLECPKLGEAGGGGRTGPASLGLVGGLVVGRWSRGLRWQDPCIQWGQDKGSRGVDERW
uniref:Uncharacterized protein n=1 Tax=Nothobranchius rachovii TaxID=451742 RepID=A0A1A8RE99_9TELE